MNGPLVLKLGGELLETAEARARLASVAAALAGQRPLALVHGGGRAVDAELDRRSIAPRKIDGLRVTDAATLDVVVSVLAGSANTELVAALVAAGVPAVGLTGVDAGFGRATRVHAHRSTTGAIVDLGLVGDPADIDPSLVELLLVHGYVPVIASLGIEDSAESGNREIGESGNRGIGKSAPRVLNVNADVMACRLAASLGACDLVIAGATPGVLDANGESIGILDIAAIDGVIASGAATAGMVAKLAACRTALLEGVTSVRIIDGRSLGPAGDLAHGAGSTFAHGIDDAPGTTIVLTVQTGADAPFDASALRLDSAN